MNFVSYAADVGMGDLLAFILQGGTVDEWCDRCDDTLNGGYEFMTTEEREFWTLAFGDAEFAATEGHDMQFVMNSMRTWATNETEA